ncbi:MAG: PHP-associated domain-containing protein [Candidatus Diapherotrites archaeon]
MQNTVTFDLHTHLNEKKINPVDYWNAVKLKGLDAVAITEHAQFEPEDAYLKLAEEQPQNIALIPGIELNTNMGHVVAYGKDRKIYEIDEYLEWNLKIDTAIEIAKEKEILLSVVHPWSLSYDSAAYIYGERKLRKIIREHGLGVEIYNGMIGQLSNFIYDTNWIKKPMNFFEFIEKNRITKKMRLSKIGAKLKDKLNEKGEEVLQRCANAIELGSVASFVTAGSDAHFPERIGSGIIKMKWVNKTLNPENVLQSLRKKSDVVWFGPYVKENENGEFEKLDISLTRTEVIQGVKYAGKRFLIDTPIKKVRKIRDKDSFQS